jgi:hypothetical protein
MNKNGNLSIEEIVKNSYEIPSIPNEFNNNLYADLMTHAEKKNIVQKNSLNSVTLKRFSLVGLTIIVIIAVSLLVSPSMRVIGQNLVQFFTKSDVNQIALPTATSTTVASEPTEFTTVSSLVTESKISAEEVATPDPKSILDAKNQVDEIQKLAQYKLMVPSWIPDNLVFSGASIEDSGQIVRIFYSLYDPRQDFFSNGLVFRQQPIPTTGDCELCTIVGADAFIQEVSISGTYGEFVEGTWKYTNEGVVWESDPLLKRMRWQVDEMAFELMFMGPADMLLIEDMVKIAESIN